jgi:hypothetical protein
METLYCSTSPLHTCHVGLSDTSTCTCPGLHTVSSCPLSEEGAAPRDMASALCSIGRVKAWSTWDLVGLSTLEAGSSLAAGSMACSWSHACRFLFRCWSLLWLASRLRQLPHLAPGPRLQLVPRLPFGTTMAAGSTLAAGAHPVAGSTLAAGFSPEAGPSSATRSPSTIAAGSFCCWFHECLWFRTCRLCHSHCWFWPAAGFLLEASRTLPRPAFTQASFLCAAESDRVFRRIHLANYPALQ